MRRILLLAFILALSVAPAWAQDRDSQWEGAAFVSAGKVGLNYSDISVDVREFVGPAFSFNEDFSAMIGVNLNFSGEGDRPAQISAFIGGNFQRYLGLGYGFDLVNKVQPEKSRYKVQHSLLFGALVRHPDL